MDVRERQNKSLEKIHNKELQHLYSTTNIRYLRVITKRKVRLVRHTVHVRKMKNVSRN
jgi:hypothetical protein